VTEIDQTVEQILLLSLELAEVTIVTNSVEGWVDFCSETFMPNTHALILNRRIDIISARDRYQREHPNDPQRWKTESFNEILNDIDNEVSSIRHRLS
jgi:oligoribonuclease (3'-5' exoribonuclease)